MSFGDMCKKFNDLAGEICREDQKKALIQFAQTLEIVPNVSLALAECR